MDERPLPGEIFGKNSDSFVGIFLSACEAENSYEKIIYFVPERTYKLRQRFSTGTEMRANVFCFCIQSNP